VPLSIDRLDPERPEPSDEWIPELVSWSWDNSQPSATAMRAGMRKAM